MNKNRHNAGEYCRANLRDLFRVSGNMGSVTYELNNNFDFHHMYIYMVLPFRAPKMGLDDDFAAAAEDISNNVNKTLSDDELKEV